MDNLTPQDLFSPSKARQQRAQAADWAHIDSWLSYKYAGRTVPTFERNEETMKVLRELSLANERADEERMIMEKVEREALKELKADEASRNQEDVKIVEATKAHLTPEGSESLRALASTAVALDTTSANSETLAYALIAHTSTSQTLSTSITHIQTLQRYLEKQHTLLRVQLKELQSNPAFSAPPSLQRQTTEQARQTKHVRAKIREYEDRLLSLEHHQAKGAATPASKGVSSAEAIADMLEQQTSLNALRQRVEGLEREVDEFAGLPADREVARKEVGKLEINLDNVRRRRDALFEGLVS
ncbi:uncharacterized protein N0V89_009599 [Didymosphaeria variabile]|uniref:HAUS augmin-like complex subunit 1 n=1 Tax=Didymosphaeria variabile TaxID=1932322 RepID=A0A9W8XE45_9PLEO|nr:uncharacterized protein N0V89_009599 [Didymosphaeria variabile]KAJ4348227.1 hypothetical protein N0V89_009599 [Didymosphaeria variabile]